MSNYLRFGFHAGPTGNPTGIGAYIRALDSAGVPAVVKATDSMTGLVNLQDAMRASGVRHVGVFRRSQPYPGAPSGVDPNVPDYSLEPEEAAALHWQYHLQGFPPELDPSLTWVEITNEPRKEVAWGDWLGHFFYYAGQMALADGYKLLAFGYSSGTPEIGTWETDGMLRYLRLCQMNPRRLGVALHEYSFSTEDIWALDPDQEGPLPGWLVGRFARLLYPACDKHGILRPTVVMTEWGWKHTSMPDTVEEAMEDIRMVGDMYSRHNVSAAIWALNGGWDGLANKVNRLIEPVTDLALSPEFQPDEPPPPDDRHKAVVVKLPQSMTEAEWVEAARVAYGFRHTMTASHDDTLTVLRGGNDESLVKFSHPDRDEETVQLVEAAGYGWQPLYQDPSPPAPPTFEMEHWPTNHEVVTQGFGANPETYSQFGFPGHDGVDIRAPLDSPVYAVADGVVARIHTDPDSHNYGLHVRINHVDGYQTIYAHLARPRSDLAVGDAIAGGTVVGYANNTGNSQGSHLHLGLKRLGHTYMDDQGRSWPFNLFDPTPYLRSLSPGAFEPGTLPPAGGLDLRHHFQASADGGNSPVYVLHHSDGRTENVQTQVTSSGVVYFVKNRQWEQLRVDADYIWRRTDTSPGPHPDTGEPRLYTLHDAGLSWSRWAPRYWRVGRVFERSPIVTWRNKDTCELLSPPRTEVTYLKFAAHYDKWISPANGDISLHSVVELWWLFSPGGDPAERYWFAPGYGLVAWASASGARSAIGEIHPERDPLVREDACI